MDKVAQFRTMVLSMSLGQSSFSEKQLKYVLNWVKENIPEVKYDEVAKIAWQYDEDELSEEIKKLKDLANG